MIGSTIAAGIDAPPQVIAVSLLCSAPFIWVQVAMAALRSAHESLADAREGYQMFRNEQNECIKVVLTP